ncbi:MAG: 3-methyl-2-oxobutanoate dehydrogenase [Deltaproteobacteria bacterium]|nr:3-methyl-2-oxobutanoate dehydrogenase [Deltaproteobacteria bacterium]
MRRTKKRPGLAKAASQFRVPRKTLESIYGWMVRLRALDERMLTLQRQGRVGFYGSVTGQEAVPIAAAHAVEATDWVFPALRESSIMLVRGYPLARYVAQVFGNAGDGQKGRQMPSHMAAREVNVVSWSSCIGTQLPQAVGAAYAMKLRRERKIALAFLGDGATSTADFHYAMNFAAVFGAPVVFVCQNNHWSISVPTKAQTASETLAQKAVAYGMPGAQVDGNDAEAVFVAVREAAERARAGAGPTLLEAVTYRIGAHSSSDDPTRYRDEREVAMWRGCDPIERLRGRLGVSQRDAEKAGRRAADEAAKVVSDVEALPMPDAVTLFEDVYAERPWNLVEQQGG